MWNHEKYILTKTLLFQLVTGCSILFFIGCSPSIRYVRSSSSSTVTSRGKYFVPPDWDYRKNYKVPETRLHEVVSGWLGTPYRYGGSSRKGIDCSGFVCRVFEQISHAKLPHSTRKLRKMSRVVSAREARAGDLVFFRGGLLRSVNHVGIYLLDNRFVHASTKNGVMFNTLNDNYYKERFVEIRRIF
jgi:hypothetical protein